MVLIDIIILIIVIGFVFLGLAMGLAKMIGSILGTIIGLFVAATFSPAVFEAYGHLLGGGVFAEIGVFIILFIIASKLIGVLLWIVGKLFDIFAWIPLAGMFNRLLGGLLGFFEAAIAICGILYFATQHISAEILLPILESSAISQLLIAAASAVSVFGPESFSAAKATFDAAKESVNDPTAVIDGVKDKIDTGRQIYDAATGSGDLSF